MLTDKFGTLSISDKSHSFVIKKLLAFQSLFKKFLYPLTLSSESFTSVPGEAIERRVNLNASALYFSIKSKGSMTLPLDLDIF